MNMKLLAVMLAVSTSAGAVRLDNIAMLDPVDIIFKGGVGVGSEAGDSTLALTLSVETKHCNQYKHCFNPFLIHLNNSAGNNTGLGLDYVYKMNKERRFAEPYRVPGDNVFLMLGAAAFLDPLNHVNGEYFNYHVGIGFEIDRAVISADVYGDPFSEREQAGSQWLINMGYRF